jgi:crotonobetainyl-CoA:carnitine CoA-transferase CaiB-like acyl-CoA transferase
VSEVEPLASFQFLNVARWTYVGDPGARGYGEGSRRVWCRDGAIAFLLFFGQTHQWDAFREVIGNPPWADAPSIRELPDPDAFWGRLNEWAGEHDKEEVYRAMQQRRVPLFPENSVAEAVDSDQVRSRGFIQPMPIASGGTARAPGAPHQMTATPARPRGPAPTLGRDNDAVYRGRLGLTEAELREAHAAGIV